MMPILTHNSVDKPDAGSQKMVTIDNTWKVKQTAIIIGSVLFFIIWLIVLTWLGFRYNDTYGTEQIFITIAWYVILFGPLVWGAWYGIALIESLRIDTRLKRGIDITKINASIDHVLSGAVMAHVDRAFDVAETKARTIKYPDGAVTISNQDSHNGGNTTIANPAPTETQSSDAIGIDLNFCKNRRAITATPIGA